MPPFQPEVVRHVTLPVLKFEQGTPVYVKILEAMHVGRKLKNDDKKEPATLCQVLNLETGEICQLVVSAVLKSTLEEEYPQHGYVQKCFSVVKMGQRSGKAYNDFKITEIKDPNPTTAGGDAGASAAGKGGKR